MTKLSNGFVINPDTFWRPCYRISPYNTGYNSINKKIIDKAIVDKEIITQFFGAKYFPTINGRSAIMLALQQYGLLPNDEVAILTTSGNAYISSCVTSEIEKVCKWSMTITDQTKLIFVNHEFGFCYEKLNELRKYGLPIIEDCALSFASTNQEKSTGTVGDFVIYSLPKFFPISFGGVLKCNDKFRINKLPEEDKTLVSGFEYLMSFYLKETESIKKKRLSNTTYLLDKFSDIGFEAFFTASEKDIPGIFMFKTARLNLPEFKKFMQDNGVESSVFYGKEAFFIPVHQNLNKEDMDLFYLLTSYFLENGNR